MKCTICERVMNTSLDVYSRSCFYCDVCDSYYDYDTSCKILLREDHYINNNFVKARIVNDHEYKKYYFYIYPSKVSFQDNPIIDIKKINVDKPINVNKNTKSNISSKIKTYSLYL